MKRRTKNTSAEEQLLREWDKDKVDKKPKSKKSENKKILKEIELSTLDLIPIKRLVDGGKTGIELTNDLGYINLFKIVSFDYLSATDEELMEHIYTWDKFHRTILNSIKFISINMPVDMTSNIRFFLRKYNAVKNPLVRTQIKENIDEFRNQLRDRETKDFYLYIHSETYDDMVKQNAKIKAGMESTGFVYEISAEQKKDVLTKYSNPFNSTFTTNV